MNMITTHQVEDAQKQQSPLDRVGNGASDSIIEALESETSPLFNTNPLHGAMVKVYGACPPEIRRSVINNATRYIEELGNNALYGLAVFDLYNEHLQPIGAVFTNPTIEGLKDIVFGQGGLYFNRSKLGKLPLIVTDDNNLAFKTAYPVYAPYRGDKINAHQLESLIKAHSDVCVIAPVHQKDDIQRRYTNLDVKMAFIPEPPSLAMIQDELDAQIKSAVEQAKLPPNGHLAKAHKMDDGSWLHILKNGLYQIKERQDENGETKQTRTHISSPLTILGEARSHKSDNWKRVVQFHDKDRKQHTLLIPYEHFMGEAQDALKLIASHGLMPPRNPQKKNTFINYIQDYPIEKRFLCVDRTGWHGNSFVTTSQTYGNHGEELLFHSEMKDPYSTIGTLEGWQELSRLIEPHARAVLSFACAFSGQLVAPLGMESGGFHIYGKSTDGKSTITKAACSVWGNPKDVSKSWRTTDNALENDAELRNDNFLNLDELGQAAPKAVSDVVYMLTGAQGKNRSSKSGKNRESKQFNLMYTSTGEIALDECLRRVGTEVDAGLLLRFAHIPSDAGKGEKWGVFEVINYGNSSIDVGNRINELSAKHYGHAGIKWLEYLTADKDKRMQQAKTMLDDFVKEHTTKNSQAMRVLRRFALVAVAGELATEASITGWQKGRSFEAVGQCFNAWLGTLGNGENIEETKMLEHFKTFFEAHGASRFQNLTVMRRTDGEVVNPVIHNRVGYYDPDNKMFLVSNEMFKKEMCIGFNEKNAKKVLKANGWLDCDDGRYTKRVSACLPDGGRPSLMHFKASVIQDFNGES